MDGWSVTRSASTPRRCCGWAVRTPALVLLLLGATASAADFALPDLRWIQRIEFGRPAGRAAESGLYNPVRNTLGKYRYWIFGTENLELAAIKGELRVQERIRQVEQIVSLDPDQRAQLELAGRGDVYRFITDCEEYLRGVDWKRVEYEDDEDACEELLAQSTRLQGAFCRGLHGSGSLFHKTLLGWLTPEQLQDYEQMPQPFYGVRHTLRVR